MLLERQFRFQFWGPFLQVGKSSNKNGCCEQQIWIILSNRDIVSGQTMAG